MKKRILALALAGTTAFSVFGAAMSANAATYDADSTHEEWNIDRYVRYKPAGNIRWDTTAVADKYVQFTTDSFFVSSDAQVKTDSGTDYYPLDTVIYAINDDKVDAFTGNDGYTLVDLSTLDSYGSLTDLMDKAGYAEFEITSKAGNITTKDGKTYLVGSDDSGKSYQVTDTSKIPDSVYDDNLPSVGRKVYIDKQYVTSDGNLNFANGSAKAMVYKPNQNAIDSQDIIDVLEYFAGNSPYYITDKNLSAAGRTNLVSAKGKYVLKTTATSIDHIYMDQSYTVLDSTDPTDFEAVMANEVKPEGEVYLYDYYGHLPYGVSVSAFTNAWNNNTLGALLEKYGDTLTRILPYDTGYSAVGVRNEVIDAWYDFLDDLGILNLSYDGLTRWAEDLVEDYAYQYYDALVVVEYEDLGNGAYTIKYESGKNLDIYNFGGLIKDILELAPVGSWADGGMNENVKNAQTSQFVYLMQQYEKYMDGYVEPVPVDTNDWGDLLVSLAQAPTAEEFATSNGYKQYTKAVDVLVSNYENASTSGELKTAETDLYDFVTSYIYKYETKPDTAALKSAIDSTYYNYKWNGTSYTGTDYTSTTTGKAAKADVGYYVGATDTDGRLSANKVNTNLSAVAFYPAADYEGSVMDGAYPGVGTGIYGVTQEYNWFYNVYALAYDVLAGNKYQSTVDLMATTLEEAIDALVPTTSATAADVLGAEEQNDKLADLVETDYQTSMWANRNKIYNYITERVSNDETGHVGATNAEILAKEAAKEMGYQRVQTTVTRSEINAVSAAKTEAQNALTALRNDEENYNAAQANALQKAIDECDVIIDLYNGDYSKSKNSQSVNGTLALQVGDKDQILKSDCDKAVEAVDAAINFKNIIQGWSQDEDDNWMYGTEEGYLNDGWHQVDGGKTWFYFNEDGTAKQSEWWQDGSTWYYFNKNCGAAVGWAQVDGKWYFFKGNNAMKTGWEKVEGSWYYLSSSGAMVTGWAQIDGKWYYFSKESNALGQMLANTTTPDGYKVDANGVLVD